MGCDGSSLQKHENYMTKLAVLATILKSNQLIIAIAVITVILFVWKMTKMFKQRKFSVKFLETFSELPSLPLIGPLCHVIKHRNDIVKLGIDWSRRYGSCWRTKLFGMDILVIHDPALLKSLLASDDFGHLTKDPFSYRNLIPGRGINGLATLHPKAWATHRNGLDPLFTYEALKSYIGVYYKHAKQLAQDLISNERDKPSYSTIINSKTLNIVTEILTGVPCENLLGQEGCLKFYENKTAALKIVETKLFSKPWTLLPIVWYFHPLKKKLDKHIEHIEIAVAKIRDLHKPKSNSKFALDLMLNAKWSDDEIIAELLTFIIAGHETVSGTMVLHLWMLSLEQEHQLACQQEVDRLFDDLEVCGGEFTFSCLSQLKYLERCVKESIRLFPATTFGTGRKLTSPLKLNENIMVGPGTMITYVPYILHRDPKIYPDPEKFCPDRFLPENVKNRHAFAYLPFSGGPRKCIGWKSAILEIMVLSAVILRQFHLSTTDMREDIKIMSGSVIYPSREPNITFRKRR